ncbi:hypothetical protein L1049_009479 [Liquidambar formosana]|uniref:Protein BIC1 n=1 Tax=Liquidambar formosana TaxID=63359 RepID=A0AAP0SBB8_LIQFO
MTSQNSTKSSRCSYHNSSPPSSQPKQTHRSDDDQIGSKNPSLNSHKSHNNQTWDEKETALQGQYCPTPVNAAQEPFTSEASKEENGRERLKRHQVEVAGQVWIPDIWGQEELLKDWIDCSAFDSSLVPNGIMSARAALVQEEMMMLRVVCDWVAMGMAVAVAAAMVVVISDANSHIFIVPSSLPEASSRLSWEKSAIDFGGLVPDSPGERNLYSGTLSCGWTAHKL